MKKAIIPIILIISIVILVIATIGINKLIIENIEQESPKQSEEAQVTVTSEIKEKLGNGIVNILIKVESDTEIENITFPNEDGSTLTVTTDKLTLAKDLKVEAGKEYPVEVKTKDGKTTKEIIKIEPTISIMVSVGDFVNYSAGNWTEADIAKLGSNYYGTGEPPAGSQQKFGKFGVGTSKDSSVYNTTYKSGWRVLNVNADGTIKIVHAGLPMCLVKGLSPTDGGALTKLIRKEGLFSMFEDCSTDATEASFAVSGSAHCATKIELESAPNSLYRLNESYWALDKIGGGALYRVEHSGIFNSSTTGSKNGVRIILTLKAEVKATATEGQTTHTTPETAWNLSLDE